MMTGSGITLPALVSSRRGLALAGGAIGGAIGVVVWGLTGFGAFQLLPEPNMPIVFVLLGGGLTGLALAYSLSRVGALTWIDPTFAQLRSIDDNHQTGSSHDTDKDDANTGP
jgi:hypothetical protein